SQNLERFGLHEMIRAEADRVNKSELCRIQLNASAMPLHLPNEKALFLYRIFQEMLNNLLKHSEASDASIRKEIIHNDLELECKDNGKGFELAEVKEGSGLMHLKQRCELIGATLKIESKTNEGARFLVTLPLE